MSRRRSSIARTLFAAAAACSFGSFSGYNSESCCGCSFHGGAVIHATGFLTAPQLYPSTSRHQPQRTQWATGTAVSQARRRRACAPAADGATGTNFFRMSAGADRNGRERMIFGARNGAVALSATLGKGDEVPTTAQMDSEWQRVLEDDEDDDEDEEEEEMTDEELLLGFDVQDEDFDDDAEGGMDDLGEDGGGAKLEARMPYKQRMKLLKAKEEAWLEKRKTFSAAHNAHIDMVEKNRAIAAARREKYTKKFFRKKKIYDIIREKEKKETREAVWATRWPRNVTRSVADLTEGEWVEGRVRNVESYGAWVDIGVERDGLLHVREMSETFTPKARDVLSTRDKVRVRVKFVNPSEGKIGLSLMEGGAREGDLASAPPRPQISISDISPGAELWGYVERATNIGAYVNVGAEVPGFLHISEIPGRPRGMEAPQLLPRNRRLRVYAMEVDPDRRRIKLTCRRPKSRPRCGPRSTLASDGYMEEFDYDDSRLPGAVQEAQWDDDGEEEDEDWGNEDGWGDVKEDGGAVGADGGGEWSHEDNTAVAEIDWA